MELYLDPKPYLLYETVSMVFSYVNNISILSVRDRMSREHRGQYDDNWYRRLGRLQEIMEDCCRDLDQDDETIQRLFQQRSTDCTSEYTYLAAVMTISFMQYQEHDLHGEIQTLKENWRRLQAEGYRVSENGAYGLNFSPLKPEERQWKLKQQIYKLKYPAELRLELLNIFLDYEAELDQLEEVLQPYARRLHEHLETEPWLMDTTAAYWRKQFETTTPGEFASNKNIYDDDFPALTHQRVCFSLMNCAQIQFAVPGEENEPGHGLFVFGCAILQECILYHGGQDLDWVLSTLRSISDRNKFEILRRLSKEQSYGQKLADELDCHTGNVSRNLTTLWKEGFLIRKEGENRVYYETDPKRLAAFLREVYDLLTGEV